MLLKLYGVLDFASGIALLLLKFGIGKPLAIILSIYLLVKSLFYIKNPASIIDIISALFIILAIFGIYNLLTYLFILWLLQKGISSIFFS